MSAYKYKVHSAIYSCFDRSSAVKSAYDVTTIVQSKLNNTTTNGLLKIDDTIIKDLDESKPKCFALIVTVVYPNGKILTRFCSCIQGSILDVKESGAVCSF